MAAAGGRWGGWVLGFCRWWGTGEAAEDCAGGWEMEWNGMSASATRSGYWAS